MTRHLRLRMPWPLAVLAVVPACAGATQVRPDPALAVMAYDRSQPLALSESLVSQTPSVRRYRISYASPAGGRVTGALAVPVAAGPHAGIVVQHGLPGNAEGAMAVLGLDVAARGAVVIAIDAPWARRRGLIDFTARDSTEQVQLIQDLQRAVDVLVARSDVDTLRLAYMGVSYGGAMGSLFAAAERRLRAVVLVVPDGGLVSHFTDAGGSPTGPLAGLAAVARDRWLAAMRPIEPLRFVARIAPTPVLFQNGRQDQLVTVEDAEVLHAAAREPRTIAWYDAGHGLNAQARADRVAWLAARIGLAP